MERKVEDGFHALRVSFDDFPGFGVGNGFVFADYSAFDMQYVISQAVDLYRSDLHGFRRVQKRGMTDDFSWNVSAGAYERLYENITENTRRTK